MEYTYEYYNSLDPATATFLSFFMLVCSILIIVATWKIFQKAGEAGWKSIIPLYGTFIKYKITWGSGWMALLLLIPIVGGIMYLMTSYKLAQVFGKGIGFTLGLIFFPFIFELILGFGNAQYQRTTPYVQPYS